MALLITKADIAKLREIAPGVRDDKINPFIEDAENSDLRSLLGERLFVAVQTTPTDHAELLEGGPYEFNGKNYHQPGLNKVLVLFAYAYYVLKGSATDTPWGFVEKTGQNSQAVSGSEKRHIYNEERELAGKYFAQVQDFMARTEYPLYNDSCQPARSGFRISKIS